MTVVILNADLGEGFGPWSMGDDAAMLSTVTSANIACGGHASDALSGQQATVEAREYLTRLKKYLQDIAIARGTLEQRLMRENLVTAWNDCGL